jgi:hypothetical protein
MMTIADGTEDPGDHGRDPSACRLRVSTAWDPATVVIARLPRRRVFRWCGVDGVRHAVS